MSMLITDDAVLILDIGTTTLKACLVNPEGAFLASTRRAWRCTAAPGIAGGLNCRPDTLFAQMMDLAGSLIRACKGVAVRAVVVSTQRLGFVLLDQQGEVLAGLPNIDRRAVREAADIAETEKESLYPITGRWQGAQHLKTRLLWFKRHCPDLYSSISRVVSIGGYFEGRLTDGTVRWEPTTACESAMFNVCSLTFLEDGAGMFGRRTTPGQIIGGVNDGIAARLGIAAGTPVICGGGDTQLGVLGAGGIREGDTVIVAGSSAPVNTVLSAAALDPACRTVTNPHVVSGRWVMEANAMMTGTTFQWTKDLLFDGNEADPYRRLNEAATRRLHEEGALPEMALFAGASTADARKGNAYAEGRLSFSMRDLNAGRITRDAVALSAFESTAYAILGNTGLLASIVGMPKRVIIGGGETRLPLLLDMLAGLLPIPIYRAHGDDMTCLGAAILAWHGIGRYESVEAAAGAMSGLEKVTCLALPHREDLMRRKEKWIQQMEEIRS